MIPGAEKEEEEEEAPSLRPRRMPVVDSVLNEVNCNSMPIEAAAAEPLGRLDSCTRDTPIGEPVRSSKSSLSPWNENEEVTFPTKFSKSEIGGE